MTYSTPLASSNYGWSVSQGNDVAITQTQVTTAISALDVMVQNTLPFTISKNTSANSLTNPIFTSLVQNGNTLAIDSSGAITTNTTLNVPGSGISVTLVQPASGILVTNGSTPITITGPSSGLNVNWSAPTSGINVNCSAAASGMPVSIVVPASGLNVNVLTNEDIKPHINDYQSSAVTKSSSALITHTNSASANLSAWTVGADCDCVFTMTIAGVTQYVLRTTAAQRQVQIMFPTALLSTGNILINVVNEDRGDNGTAFSVINGYQQ